MKNFVFNFISGDQKKFESGEELFNLIATCLAFDQKVTVISDKEVGSTFFEDLNLPFNISLECFNASLLEVQTETPFPAANPSAFTTIGPPFFLMKLDASLKLLKIPKFAVGIPFFLHRFFIKAFEPSN